MNDTRGTTVAVTIAGDRMVLPSRIIFKGKHDGRIAQLEFATYPAGHHYCCQDAAWMDKHVMLAWVEEVLAPYGAMAPDDIVPLLILDSYQCHMRASVVYKIQELGVEVKHISGGCTSLCQPVDVGFIHPSSPASKRCGSSGSLPKESKKAQPACRRGAASQYGSTKRWNR
jgi:hypothetical protein